MEERYQSFDGGASLRPSFREALRLAKEQVKLADTARALQSAGEREIAEELCKIIAEVYMMRDDKPIRISGEWLDGYIVKEVFREINEESFLAVIEGFGRLSDEIKNVKAYLRTMLYNSVFSIEAQYSNRVRHDLAHFSGRGFTG